MMRAEYLQARAMSLSLEMMAWTQAGLSLVCGGFGVFGFKGPDLLLSPRMTSAPSPMQTPLVSGTEILELGGRGGKTPQGPQTEETELGFGLHLYSSAPLTPAAEEEGEANRL